jgi:hypothetical protein
VPVVQGGVTVRAPLNALIGPEGPTGPIGPPGDGSLLSTSPITATGTTTSRTLATRFADVVNVKDFGAVGGTAGDKAAFEAAIASVTGNSATIYVPRAASSYTLGSSVNVLGKNVTYQFEAGASVSSYNNLNGNILRPQRLVRKTYGIKDQACGYTVRVNDGDNEAEVLGFSADSALGTYSDRDSVAMYVHNRAPAVQHTCTGCTYTATTITFTNALDPNGLKVGMIIDTAHATKYSGRVASWNVGGTQITVTGWYQTGDTAEGQIPSDGTDAYVNPTTKVWAHNANVILRSDSHATHAAGFELGIIQEKAAYDDVTDLPRTWGYDIVNLGANRCSVGVIQRGDFRHGFESRSTYRAGFCVSSTGSPTYGFLAESGTNRFAALSSIGTTSWTVSADGAMEVGRNDVSNTPFIDFHSAGLGTDHDVRLLVEGGSATAGTGTLRLKAGDFRVYENTQANAAAITGSATGAEVKYLAVGSDSTVNAVFSGKGAGHLVGIGALTGIGNESLRVGTVASQVNHVRISGSATGTGVTVKAGGSDANCPLLLQGNGTGGVQVATTGQAVGFYGTAPGAKPTVTGSRGGNAALESLLSALAALGLITDSTTA